MTEHTSRARSGAGSPEANGHNGHDPVVASPPTALSGTLQAHLCGIDPDNPLSEALSGEALAAFAAYNNARRKIGLMPYAVDTPLCDVPALPIAVAHLTGQEPTRAEIAEWSVEAMEDDPHDVMSEFEDAKREFAAGRIREVIAERSAKHALRDAKVSPRALFTLETIEAIDGVGSDVARRARAAVLKINRQAWSAVRPHNYAERNDLITSVELHRLGVDAEVIADLPQADDDDEIDANERLTRTRTHYAKYGTVEVIDVAGGVVSPVQMCAKEPPRRMLGHWLYFGQLSELIAEPGGGKTFVALGMGLPLAAGNTRRAIGVLAPRRVKVLYVAAEAPESAYLRVLGWCQHNDIPPGALDDWFGVYPQPVQLADPEHMRQVRRYVSDNDVELVVFDTRHMVTLGLDENSSGDQGVAIGALKALNNDGAATLVVHHTGKDGSVGNGGRGSGAWFAAAYTSMYLRKDDKLGPVLVCDKLKDAKSDRCKHPLHYAPVRVSEALMSKARDDERDTLALTVIDPFHDDSTDPQALTDKELNLLLLLAHHAGFKGMTVTEIKKHASTKSDPDSGYDIGSHQTIYDSLKVLRGITGSAPARYVREASKEPLRCRVTDAGWDLLVERERVTAAYAEANRHTAEDVGTEQFRTACQNIAEAMTTLIERGEILASNKQTEPAARRLVESYLGGEEQLFSTAAWAAVFSRWKDENRPATVTTAASDRA